ncbi:DUF2278 family protein [Rhizobacter sp. SG703]|uniref:DUF2278 family protein n=1 Tax=Rhizobacter sp. SG703 TaxID=2587140 RepID=UPI00144648F1|nr:DUF2278 family protein [Rhizobacter sp. SG703]NKI95004.1 uncharacterized protein YukJ [Rhizobacter sp. SG703]
MPIAQYGVLCGRAIDRQPGSGAKPHYQIHVIDGSTDYRIAVNVASALAPSEVEYLIEPQFVHPVLQNLSDMSPGWHALSSKPGGAALDFIRTNLFDPRKMVPLPINAPGPDNDLNEKLDHYVQRAMADEEAMVFAFGQRWGPEAGKKDAYFGFLPGNGVHDIHMNQANVGQFTKDDGVYQDGALLLHYPAQQQWVGIFLKFQSQTWHTDDKTGHQTTVDTSGPTDPAPGPGPFVPGNPPTPDRPDGMLRIVSALVNSIESPEVETVTLLNATPKRIDLGGWKLLDRNKAATPLSGPIEPGETRRFKVATPMALSNKGGMISVINADGLRVDGVTYSKADASLPGYSVKF